jgi:hypothetical protein
MLPGMLLFAQLLQYQCRKQGEKLSGPSTANTTTDTSYTPTNARTTNTRTTTDTADIRTDATTMHY